MMSVAEVFDMVEDTNHLQGILFYNDKESYFGILRQDFDQYSGHFLRQRLKPAFHRWYLPQ